MHPYLEYLQSFFARTPVQVLSLGFILLLIGIYIRPDTYPPITPLPASFNWETTEPLVLRPFKPKYHLTMGITTLPPSELLPIDKTYLSRLALRKQLLSQYPDVVRAVNLRKQDRDMNGKIREALFEWYAFVMGVYLPGRYPGMFRVLEEGDDGDGNGKGRVVESAVTGKRVPVEAGELIRRHDSSLKKEGEENDENELQKEKNGLLHVLDTMASWIDEDFLILLPSPVSPENQSPSDPSDPSNDPKYHLQAFTTYYPAGFDTRTKLSLPLSAIHAPVPGYKEKLEKSMDRFFSRLEVGRFVVRVNWSVMTKGTGLFAAFGGLHEHDSGKGDGNGNGQEEEIQVEGFDGEETYLRCERQTLHRLPRSKALIFAFHTYTYPLKDIKAEGLGEDMAVAIDGLKGGNVPEVYPYKRGPYWGEAVKAFLRS
ncbi:hypothetical protein BJX70DRAFT_388071 [Aspergillus crustosus]